MFEDEKPKYMTRAVSEELSFEHKQFILKFIFINREKLKDYLQVIEFCIENNEQFLIQRQEVPKRKTKILLTLKETEPISKTVWVMDQNDHVMILFPEDY